MSFVFTQFKCQTVLFSPIDRTLSDTTTLGQSGPVNDGNEGVLCIPQSSIIFGASPCDFLMSMTLSSKFREGSWVQQTPEAGRRTFQLKRCGNNNNDEDNSPKTLNYINLQGIWLLNLLT